MFREPTGMPYPIWAERLGSNRWYDSQGNPRIYSTLDQDWKKIFDLVTRDADRVFHMRTIEDVPYFTDHFLSMVPHAWEKFKVQLEMFMGTLTGVNIDPQEFYAGFERWTTHNLTWDDDETVSNSADSTTHSENDSTDTSDFGEQTGEGRTRQINYVQGVQDNDREFTDANIGLLGADYASGNSDAVSLSEKAAYTDKNTGNSVTDGDNHSSSKGTRAYDRKEAFDEHIKENRINFYDQLAFLRERFDRLGGLRMFWQEFEPLFTSVSYFEKVF